jgi:hypothetical protein
VTVQAVGCQDWWAAWRGVRFPEDIMARARVAAHEGRPTLRPIRSRLIRTAFIRMGFVGRGLIGTIPVWIGVVAVVAGSTSVAQATPAGSADHDTTVLSQSAAGVGPGVADSVTRWPQATGERLLDTPTTTPCTVTVVKNYAFKNTAYGPDKNFSGPYNPPGNCAGPWSRVVATVSVHVTGVQFDRIGDVRLGDTDIFAYTTPEPRGNGSGNVTWSKSKDVTDYTDLLLHHQKISFEIGNVITGPYNGVYYGTLRLTFYPADSSNPVPASTPDVVLPVIREAMLSSDTPEADGTVTVPQSSTSLTADLIIQGHGGCDEFWWADAPPPFPGQCGGPPYREAEVFVDGRLAGIVEPYPYLFTGANGPSWWEPVSAPQTLNLRPWRLNLTPFLGTMTDGQPHQLSIKMLDWSAQSGNDFRVNLALLVDTSGQSGATVGGLTSTRANPHARILQTVTATHYSMDASHSFTAVGWYQTPGGPKVTTTVQQDIHAVSNQSTATGVHNHYSYQQVTRQQTAGSSGAKGSLAVTTDNELAKLFSLDTGWALKDAASSVQTVNGTVEQRSLMVDGMTSFLVSGAHVSNERWRYADTQGVCGTTTLAGDNGTIVSDVKTPRCIWAPADTLARHEVAQQTD